MWSMLLMIEGKKMVKIVASERTLTKMRNVEKVDRV